MNQQVPGSHTLSPATEAELNQLNTDYIAAFNAGNAPALAALFAEDAVIMNSFGSFLMGRPAIQAALAQSFASLFQRATLQITPQYVRQLSEDTILQQGTFRTTREGGPQNYGDFSYTRIFVRQNGHWQLAAAQFAKPEGPPAQSR